MGREGSLGKFTTAYVSVLDLSSSSCGSIRKPWVSANAVAPAPARKLCGDSSRTLQATLNALGQYSRAPTAQTLQSDPSITPPHTTGVRPHSGSSPNLNSFGPDSNHHLRKLFLHSALPHSSLFSLSQRA